MSILPIAWLDEDDAFPPADEALRGDSDAPGLLAAGGDLSIPRLRAAYGSGIFPWYSAGQPVLWWSPDPRMVLHVDELHVTRSLRKTLRRFIRTPGCEVRIDTAFGEVIRACARTPREGQDGTWILPEMVAAYEAWHAKGEVHSFETWVQGRLVGGLYGVCLGRMFFGESMFSWQADASKIALAALVAFCRQHGIGLIDCQQRTSHLASLGAREIPRTRFLAQVRDAVRQAPVPRWHYDRSTWEQLGLAADRPPAR
ncbi:MAG TPA: leucyl/phenylalanyl-tRNA--protein transferase [Burkholderiaceae bacterium]|nr:leucyl/phenylalanyl-tRNA--protein transferase [Burkholderiaceae bacterium]